MGACTEIGKLQIVTERCATDLEKLLAEGEYEFHQLMRFARDIAKGMLWLHYSNPPTIHRDLKPANILIDFNDQVKISDFGLSQVRPASGSIRDKPRGSLIWMAPEVMLSKPFNEKIDVYSFGIILWQMATKKTPYTHLTSMKLFIDAICFDDQRPPLDEDDLPPAIQTLLQKCWDPNPNERYEFFEIVFRLNEIITDAVIKDVHAAMFWKRKFLATGHQELREQVEWPEFQTILAEELNVPPEKIAKLRSFIAQTEINQGNEFQYVSMARFYQFVQWFGAFYDSSFGQEIIQQMIKLQDAVWFHGCISRELANSRLTGRSTKTFLVRLSNADPIQSPFSVSFPNNEHERVERVAGGLQDPKGNIYKTIFEYIAARPKKLKYACPKADNDVMRYKAYGNPPTPKSPSPLPVPLRFESLSLSSSNEPKITK